MFTSFFAGTICCNYDFMYAMRGPYGLITGEILSLLYIIIDVLLLLVYLI